MKAPTGTQHKPQSLTSAATPSPMCNVYRCLQHLLFYNVQYSTNASRLSVCPSIHSMLSCAASKSIKCHLTGAPSKPELTEHTLFNFLTNVSFNLRVTMISPLSSVCSWKQPPKPRSCRTKSGEKGRRALVMPLSVHTHASYATATRSTPKRFSKNCFILAISIFPKHTQEREMLCRCWK